MKSATLDTSLLLEYWKEHAKMDVVEELIAMATSGELDLAVTARIRDDVPRAPLSDRINCLPELSVKETGTVFRLDRSRLDGPDMLGDERFLEVSQELSTLHPQGKSAPDWRDWDHLHAHFLGGREAFLTWDGAILELAPELKTRLGVMVMSPEAFLARCRPNGTVQPDHSTGSRSSIAPLLRSATGEFQAMCRDSWRTTTHLGSPERKAGFGGSCRVDLFGGCAPIAIGP